VKRPHERQQIVGDLLSAKINETQALPIKCRVTIAKLPLAGKVDALSFEDTPVTETLVRDLAGGKSLEHPRDVVPRRGTGTGKPRLAASIARSCTGRGKRGRLFNRVDLVNRLDAEARAGGPLLFHLLSRLKECTSIIVTAERAFGERPCLLGDARMTTGRLDRLPRHCDSVEAGTEAWRIRTRAGHPSPHAQAGGLLGTCKGRSSVPIDTLTGWRSNRSCRPGRLSFGKEQHKT